jgi:hypothetical protein
VNADLSLVFPSILQEHDRLQKRIGEVLTVNKELEKENVHLGSKIEVLSAEVTSSRALIDKLLKTSHETQASDWEKKEYQYKSAIRNYQQQIRKPASTVSLELYRAAVDDSKFTQSQLQDAERKIRVLETRVSTQAREDHATEETKTPDPRRSQSRNFLLSPTDYLEKGLLSMDYQHNMRQSSPQQEMKTISPTKMSKTPLSYIKTGLDVEMKVTDKTQGQPSETAKRGYRSPVENFYLTRIVPSPLSAANAPSPHPIEQTTSPEKSKPAHNDVLLGTTVSFEAPFAAISSSPNEMGSPWPISKVPVVDDINEWVDQYTQKYLSSTEKKKKSGERTTPVKLQHSAFENYRFSKGPEPHILSPCWKAATGKRPTNFTKSFCTPASKENHQNSKISPKSGSKTLRMRKARELGGMKGLRSELNRIRSPQSLGKPKRVARVLGDRLVN